MGLRDQLPPIIARDPRFTIEAYGFVLEALHHARLHKLKSLEREGPRARGPARPAGKGPGPGQEDAEERPGPLDEAESAEEDQGRSRAASPSRSRSRSRRGRTPGHVNGRELCEAVRRLALRQYGLLAIAVLAHWGVRSTSDIGSIVYNLIATGDLEKTPSDSRGDFDDVFDFETALRPRLVLPRLDAI